MKGDDLRIANGSVSQWSVVSLRASETGVWRKSTLVDA